MGVINVGIVGHGASKFNERQKTRAISHIVAFITLHDPCTIVSGHSPVGGVDVWAEDTAKILGMDTQIYAPTVNAWNPAVGYGYKARNLDIARNSDIVYVIVVRDYKPSYTGMRFDSCYHCDKHPMRQHGMHIKSGACWTAWKAVGMGKRAKWVVIT